MISSRFTFLTFGYIYKHNLGNHWSFGIFWAHGFCSGSRRKKLQTMRFKTPDGLCPHVKPKPRTRIELIDADWWFAILFQGCLRIWEKSFLPYRSYKRQTYKQLQTCSRNMWQAVCSKLEDILSKHFWQHITLHYLFTWVDTQQLRTSPSKAAMRSAGQWDNVAGG